ncbi:MULTISPECIES: LytTR family DNA-binding domain-containing protein [Pseudoalteromonas]|uniref:LytTR family DNA-binding domain-containing protein n=1 Tax=Pseudoalteromonas maricaloris TaxID=184924 RepID=A0A8I2H2I4_9GAMM|nr:MULTISPECIES: LytTR family DNA-binding domain-containing protein [Pseudoalteromonas]NLR21941.1 LytTR family transcriptional regulator [Pseudoalteromonas maricaloris]RZG13167.1 LytTR family transcriptional regulator [Pseudoalteromonas sp. CO342X]WOX28644.1 LytTR family DNA-binding domain-containing protein [Pseudoalteromonas maricaloris]
MMFSRTFIQQYHPLMAMALLALFLTINNTLNAITLIMDANRDAQLDFALWEPFVWEYTSAAASLALIPTISWYLNAFPWLWHKPVNVAFSFFIASLLFCFGHVGIMVLLRETIYFSLQLDYNFHLSWFELIYEYQKDAWSLVFFIALIKAYQFSVSHMLGEASPIKQESDEDETLHKPIHHLLVRKLGKEFIVKVEEVEWLQSSGNYVNLHVNGRIYPLRSTLATLCQRLDPVGFVRIHRSFAINVSKVVSITPLASGDSEIALQSGKVLTLSRTYKTQFKHQLSLE